MILPDMDDMSTDMRRCVTRKHRIKCKIMHIAAASKRRAEYFGGIIPLTFMA